MNITDGILFVKILIVGKINMTRLADSSAELKININTRWVEYYAQRKVHFIINTVGIF